jgi:hypothetical protein
MNTYGAACILILPKNMQPPSPKPVKRDVLPRISFLSHDGDSLIGYSGWIA